MHGCVFCTDSFEGVAVHPAPDDAQRIPAKNVHAMCLGKLVAECFYLNRRIHVALRPQEVYAFAENGDTGVLPRCCLPRFHYEIAYRFQKSDWIRYPINYEHREGVGGIQWDISALLNSRIDIQAFCLQLQTQVLPVRFGRDDDGCIPSAESRCNEPRYVL